MSWNADSDRAADHEVDADWPNRQASQFIRSGGLRWHVQRANGGAPKTVLLVHGTGASTHSWRDIFPVLAAEHEVIAIDLPGHGFTGGETRDVLSLAGMAGALGRLLQQEGVRPALVVGHSAGAAILLQMCIDRVIQPDLLISLNGALLPFPGVAGAIFPTLAKLVYLNPLMPYLLARRADDLENVRRLISGMGSEIDEAGLRQYARLFRDRRHVNATIKMMAYWNLRELPEKFGQVNVPVLLVAGTDDRAIPVETQFDVCDRLPSATVKVLRRVGHLAHEEQPAIVAQIILDAAQAGSAAFPIRNEANDDPTAVS